MLRRSIFWTGLYSLVLGSLLALLAGWLIWLITGWITTAEAIFWIVFCSFPIAVFVYGLRKNPNASYVVVELMGWRVRTDTPILGPIFYGADSWKKTTGYLKEGLVAVPWPFAQLIPVFYGRRRLNPESTVAQAADGQEITADWHLEVQVIDPIAYQDAEDPEGMLMTQSERELRLLVSLFDGDRCRQMSGDFEKFIQRGCKFKPDETDSKEHTETVKKIPSLGRYAKKLGLKVEASVTDILQSKDVLREYNERKAEETEFTHITETLIPMLERKGIMGAEAMQAIQIERGKASRSIETFTIGPELKDLLSGVLGPLSEAGAGWISKQKGDADGTSQEPKSS